MILRVVSIEAATSRVAYHWDLDGDHLVFWTPCFVSNIIHRIAVVCARGSLLRCGKRTIIVEGAKQRYFH
jgi:hypothetical protein